MQEELVVDTDLFLLGNQQVIAGARVNQHQQKSHTTTRTDKDQEGQRKGLTPTPSTLKMVKSMLGIQPTFKQD